MNNFYKSIHLLIIYLLFIIIYELTDRSPRAATICYRASHAKDTFMTHPQWLEFEGGRAEKRRFSTTFILTLYTGLPFLSFIHLANCVFINISLFYKLTKFCL